MKECFVLDISNLKFSLFGLLNQKRSICGAIKRDKLLWVYGGYDNGYVDSIERIELPDGVF